VSSTSWCHFFPTENHTGYESWTACGLSGRSECLWSAFIEEVDDEDLFVPPSSPQPIIHTTVQHVDDPNFINVPEPARTSAPLLTNNLDEDIAPLIQQWFPTIPWWPKPNSLQKNTALHQSDWCGCLKVADWYRWRVYTINIQSTSDYLDIKALQASATNPLPHLLYTLSTSYQQGGTLCQSCAEVYQDFFNVLLKKEAKNMPPHCDRWSLKYT